MIARYYHHDEETGMERWHDGDETMERCHDGVGLITTVRMPLDEYLERWPDADELEVE